MPFDLYAVQKDLENYLTTTFPHYYFVRSTQPEDQQIPREGEEVNPFFILQFGQMYQVARGKSMAGAKNDEYSSWMNIISVSSVEDDAAAALSLPVGRLIGYKPVGANELTPDGGPTDYGSRQYSVRPVLYYQSQRFSFTLNQNGLDGYLSS